MRGGLETGPQPTNLILQTLTCAAARWPTLARRPGMQRAGCGPWAVPRLTCPSACTSAWPMRTVRGAEPARLGGRRRTRGAEGARSTGNARAHTVCCRAAKGREAAGAGQESCVGQGGCCSCCCCCSVQPQIQQLNGLGQLSILTFVTFYMASWAAQPDRPLRGQG